MTSRTVILSAVLALLVAACSSVGGAGAAPTLPSPASVELTIFAAASLKNMLAEAETAYEGARFIFDQLMVVLLCRRPLRDA